MDGGEGELKAYDNAMGTDVNRLLIELRYFYTGKNNLDILDPNGTHGPLPASANESQFNKIR